MKSILFFSIALFLFSCTSTTKNEIKKNQIISMLEIYSLEDSSHKIVYQDSALFEAPNWTRNGRLLVFNKEGKLYSIPVTGGEPTEINTGFATKCNNDHGLSPDNSMLVVSHHEEKSGKSMIYSLPFEGGVPTLITKNAPSYWHGWSPDGGTLAYCAERNGEFDIYTIPVTGGEEKRLTSAPGLDDGPDYSCDGKYIYFNSVRTGKMKIWRMKTDGSEPQQMTFDEYNDWFAHPSPDGKWMAFVSYDKDVEGHPANKNVRLRIMPLEGGEPKTIVELFGGQGTINVPSWSPDSKKFAYVSYKLVE